MADKCLVSARASDLQLNLHLAEVARADPMRQSANIGAAIARLAPGADRDAQWKLSLTHHVHGPVAARELQTFHRGKIYP
jgi:hypothetical protein